jgi:hypothetical protein
LPVIQPEQTSAHDALPRAESTRTRESLFVNQVQTLV